jgi:hypothetical protein
MSEVRRQKSEDGRQMSEERSGKQIEVGSGNAECGKEGLRAEERSGKQVEVGSRNAEFGKEDRAKKWEVGPVVVPNE